MRTEARENLNPAEKIGVKESNPRRIASQVEPQSKQIRTYAREIFKLSENN